MKSLTPSRETLLSDNRVTLIVGLVAVVVMAVPTYVNMIDQRRAMEQTAERVEFIEQGMGRRSRSWRVAESLVQLRAQANQFAPSRSRSSDGTIGDAAHASRSSDHNPWVKKNGAGIVTAIDLTNDPRDGFDCEKIAAQLVASRDPRIKYIIWNYRIVSSTPARGKKAWQWRRYNGSNPHDKHIHISVASNPAAYDSSRPWSIGPAARTTPTPKPAPSVAPKPKPAVSQPAPATVKAPTVKAPKARLVLIVPKVSGDLFVPIHSAIYTSQKFFTVNQSDVAGSAFKKSAPSVRVSLRTALAACGYDVDHGYDRTDDKADPRYYIWVRRAAPIDVVKPQPTPTAAPAAPQAQPQTQPQPVTPHGTQRVPAPSGLLSTIGRMLSFGRRQANDAT